MRDYHGIELDESGLCPGATAEAVAQVERDLGVQFPAVYKEFLAFADGGVVGNFIFYSVGDGVHPAERLVAAHQRGGPDCPIVAIGREASDDFGLLRTELSAASLAIHFMSHETWETVKAAPSFFEFLRRIAALKPGEPLHVDGAGREAEPSLESLTTYDDDMQRLAVLARQYRSLSLAEEKAGKGEACAQEYWSIVDRLLDAGQLDRPLDDDHLIDRDFWSDKYDAFWNAYRERHLPWYYKAIRWVIFTALRWIYGRSDRLL